MICAYGQPYPTSDPTTINNMYLLLLLAFLTNPYLTVLGTPYAVICIFNYDFTEL